jgi:sugar lactone lactonase YvrE
VAVDREGRVLVADSMSPDLWVRDFRGRLLQRIELPPPDDRREVGGAGPIAVARDGRIFVASRARDARVHVYSPEFVHLGTWGEPGSKPGQLSAVTGIACLGDSEIVVTCLFTEFGVQVFDARGQYRRGFGIHEVGPENISQPAGVTVDASDRIWVLDAVRRTIQTYDAAGTLLGVTGGGDGPGSWLYPSALAGDGRGFFALAESGGNRLRLLWIR